MPEQLSAVTLREVGGDPEELWALQAVMESDEDFALQVTGVHRVRPMPRARRCSSPKASHPTKRWSSACGSTASWSGCWICCCRYPDQETVYLGLLLID